MIRYYVKTIYFLKKSFCRSSIHNIEWCYRSPVYVLIVFFQQYPYNKCKTLKKKFDCSSIFFSTPLKTHHCKKEKKKVIHSQLIGFLVPIISALNMYNNIYSTIQTYILSNNIFSVSISIKNLLLFE
jgi:high-affinity Fe2+/Pb2+ permease